MKKIWRIAFVVIALSAICGETFGAPARQEPPMGGGYQKVSTDDAEVASAARFAINTERRKRGTRISLVGVENAERQVVAGMNYRLCLRVKSRGKVRNVTTVVYKNLKQKYSLTSWETTTGCKKEE